MILILVILKYQLLFTDNMTIYSLSPVELHVKVNIQKTKAMMFRKELKINTKKLNWYTNEQRIEVVDIFVSESFFIWNGKMGKH